MLVDGVDVRRYPLAGYRHRLGIVPQEPHLFTGDVAANIAYGRPDADAGRGSRPRPARSARSTWSAPCRTGSGTPVGERGQGLSAGQRQLVALARAELVDPDLLLFDEATAALDPATEAAVLAAGDQVTSRRTAFVVAHRLATAARVGPDRRARRRPDRRAGPARGAARGRRAVRARSGQAGELEPEEDRAVARHSSFLTIPCPIPGRNLAFRDPGSAPVDAVPAHDDLIAHLVRTTSLSPGEATRVVAAIGGRHLGSAAAALVIY